VIQVIAESNGEVLYTIRAKSNRFQPHVYAAGSYTVKIGKDKPDAQTLTGLKSGEKDKAGSKTVKV